MGAGEYNQSVRVWLWHQIGYGHPIDIIEEAKVEEEYDFLIMRSEYWNNEYFEYYGIAAGDYDTETVNGEFVVATRKAGK